MDKMIRIFLEEITKFWRAVKNYVKNKIKKIVTTCPHCFNTLKNAFKEINGLRISYHEKVCAERMKTLFKAIDEMRVDIKNLHSDMNKGKGVINFLVIIGGTLAVILGFFKMDG